jgi:cytochrome c-type biogenesis protein CcmF
VTIAVIGQALVMLALCAAVVGVVTSAIAGRRLRQIAFPAESICAEPDTNVLGSAHGFQAVGIRAGQITFAAALAASLVLLVALARGEFALRYVADRTSADLPVAFRLTALWSGQEGSLLLWLTVLTGLGLLMVRSATRGGAPPAMVAYANCVLLGVACFFALLVSGVARPFALVDTLAADGAGMSPALQNYWMALHPPALYLGYVGVTVPFALVAGALLARVPGDAWINLTRRWALLAWTGLSIGLLLGARWAYEEIGWGGYWAWDPVENAALMPWLTTTAFIHSVMVQQRRGMLRYWNVILVTLTFVLSVFGTFLTRSGVLSSVHSFVSSPVGWWFLGFLAVVCVLSLTLLYVSRGQLAARHSVQSAVSREAAFLFNNLLLVSIALTVLWGVLFPILTAAVDGERVALQAPWYNFFAVTFGLPLLALLGIGPFVSWQRSTARAVASALWLPFAFAVAISLVGFAAGLGSSATGLAAIGLGAFVLAGCIGDVIRGVRARKASHDAAGGEGAGWRHAARGALARNRRRYGGMLAHAGIALMAVAIAGSTAYDRSVQRDLTRGDTIRVGQYTLTYTGSTRTRSASAMQTRAAFDVTRNGHSAGSLRAGKDFHPASGEVSNEVGIHHDLHLGEDLFVAVDTLREDGGATVTAIVNPAVNLLWIAGLLVIAGGVIAAVPGRSRATDVIRTPASGYTHSDAVPIVRKPDRAPGQVLSAVRRVPARPARRDDARS